MWWNTFLKLPSHGLATKWEEYQWVNNNYQIIVSIDLQSLVETTVKKKKYIEGFPVGRAVSFG